MAGHVPARTCCRRRIRVLPISAPCIEGKCTPALIMASARVDQRTYRPELGKTRESAERRPRMTKITTRGSPNDYPVHTPRRHRARALTARPHPSCGAGGSCCRPRSRSVRRMALTGPARLCRPAMKRGLRFSGRSGRTQGRAARPARSRWCSSDTSPAIPAPASKAQEW